MNVMRIMPAIPALMVCITAAKGQALDEIEVGDKRYESARIVRVENGRLVFRNASYDLLAVPLRQVTSMFVGQLPRFEVFNEAERLAKAGQPQVAIGRYERALTQVAQEWQPLVRGRILRIALEMGQGLKLIQGLKAAVDAGEVAPADVGEWLPGQWEGIASSELTQMAAFLESAEHAAKADDRRALYLLLRYEIMMRLDARRAGAMAPIVAKLHPPDEMMVPRLCAIQIQSIERWLTDDPSREPLDPLDDGIRRMPELLLPRLLLLKGERLRALAKTPQERIQAAWTLLRVPIHFPQAAEGAPALVAAGEICLEAGSRTEAATLLREALSRADIDEALKAQAVKALESATGGARG